MRGALDTIIRAFWGTVDAGDAVLWRTRQALRRARHYAALRWDAALAALAEARGRPDTASRTPRRIAVAALLCTAGVTAVLISGGAPGEDTTAASKRTGTGTALAADDHSLPAAGWASEASEGASRTVSRRIGVEGGDDGSVPAAEVSPAPQEVSAGEPGRPSAPAPPSRRESRIRPSPRDKARSPRLVSAEPAPAPQAAPAPPSAPSPVGPAPEDDEGAEHDDDDDDEHHGGDGRGNGHGHHHDDDDG